MKQKIIQRLPKRNKYVIMVEKKDINSMASDSNKKLLILYILKILQEYSDENHPLTYQNIIDKIYSTYGMSAERKSIAANIQSLIDFGYEIENIPRHGWYMSGGHFEDAEIAFLIDAVFSSGSISGKHSVELADKLSALLSTYKRKKYKYIYKAKELHKPDNKQLFYTIDVLSQAIEEKKKVSFQYIKYDKDRKAVNRFEGYRYKVNPYFMLNNKGKYFLICNYDKYDTLNNYKLDRIANIEILEEEVKPITALPRYENGLDITTYVNENVYMFGDKSITAELKLSHEWVIDILVEWFGDNVRITEKDGEYFATVKATEGSIIVWALQYGDCVEILSPTDARQRMKDIIEKMYNKYNR